MREFPNEQLGLPEDEPSLENIEQAKERSFTYVDNSDPAEPKITKLKAYGIPEADAEYEKLTGKKLDLREGRVSRSFVYGQE